MLNGTRNCQACNYVVLVLAVYFFLPQLMSVMLILIKLLVLF